MGAILMTTSLILLRNDASLGISVTPEALAAKETALENASMVQVVCDAPSQEMAVAAQAEVHRLILACEKSRKDVKAPVLDYGRTIDGAAADFSDVLRKEEFRLSKLIGDFQALEAARVRSEEMARNQKLTQIEREREAELAKVKSHEERETIQQRYSEAAQAVPIPPPAAKAEGQVVRPGFEFEVVDIHTLYRHHPHLVKLEPRRSEIIEALKGGVQIQGIKSWPVVKSGVRV